MKKYELLPTRKPIDNPLLMQYLPRWMDNSNPDDLGIVRFGFEMFPNTVDQRFGLADWVAPTLFKILEYEAGMTKIDRAWSICTSREYSKTTWLAKILPLYFMLVGQYGIYYKGKHLLPEADYIRLRAKTQEKAEEKLTNVTVEFSNPNVLMLFGDLRPTFKEIRDEKLKNQAKLMILKNGYVFQAQGLNQPSRGANIRDKRPKIDINDDVENKENTKTQMMRAYNAKEILGEQFGGLDISGLTIYVGNYVHQECLMAKMQKPNSGWKRLYFQASYLDEKGVERSGWSRRFSVTYLRRLGEWYRNQPDLGGWKIFRMEYYNEVVSDKEYIVPVVKGRYVRKDGMNFVYLTEEQKYIRVHIVVSGDPAISEKKKTSNVVASVVGFGEDKKRYVISIAAGKFDISDRYHDDSKRPRILAVSPEEMGNVRRVGLVSEMGRKILAYNANGFVLENAGQQLAWFNDLKEDVLRPLGLVLPGMAYHPKDEKIYKLETGLMNQVSAERYVILDSCQNKALALTEIGSFPDTNNDVLDTWFNAEQMGKIPPKADVAIGHKFYDPANRPKKKSKVEEQWVVLG
jgi:hypothetical protein